jgi:acyl-CoA thioester hydrolase
MPERTLYAGWGDMDFNAHMKNTAYLDKSADARMLFFADHGFPMSEFVRLRIGPVILKDQLEYFREAGLLERLRVTTSLVGLAEDGSRFEIRNEFYSDDGKSLARVTSFGGWLDLTARKLVTPPAGLLAALRILPRAPGFQVLPSASRSSDGTA